jgi:ABC-2 type transport system ATP-binding protein
VYRVHEREAGLGAALRSLVTRKYRDVGAVMGVSFPVREGEVVGFLGPNGAGKTTTLKMLSGLLYPTSGEARVMGSLGERMKCELAAALLHRPSVLFLDEPTLGVDVTMQTRIRQFIAEYNQTHGATILLTSHYMADVTALCRRVIVIHHGRILYDGDLDALAVRMAPFKQITIDLEREPAGIDFARFGELVRREGQKVALRVPKSETAAVTARLLAELPVLDLSVEDPPIEEVIDRVFQERDVGAGVAAAGI